MSKLTLDEAIKHCEEQVAKYERQCEYGISKEGKEYNSQCAADHRQLAEWLTELKELRSIVDACNILAVDAFAVENLCKELKEAKRLLKVAMDDMNILYEAGKDEGCIGIKFKWRFADEALKLIES